MEYINHVLSSIKEKGLYRNCTSIQSPQTAKVILEGKETLLFGSNNYLGLSDHVKLKEAAIEATHHYGVGAGGSRLTTGSYDLHDQLEKRIAAFKGTEASLVFNTGYMANTGIISALCNRDWVIFSDKLNHASIVDGCILSRAKLIRYNHCDMQDLEQKILKHKGKYNLLVTDGVFSMDGDLAPLLDIVELAKKYQLITMVDDAHGLGVLGDKGAGVVSHFGLHDEIDIQMGTLSKSIPSVGGYVAGKKGFIDYFKNISRSFIFSTALPPSSIAVSLKAMNLIEEEQDRRNHLHELSNWFRTQLIEAGFQITNTITPIIPVMIGDAATTVQLRDSLLEDGIFIPAIRPPTVPKGTSRLRISLMATHSYEDVNYALERLIFHSKSLGIIEG